MLKLKYLFDNRDLAIMLLKNWNYDETSLNLFENFRISSNAIYPFKNQEKLYFLRFVPELEKSKDSINQELEFITLLSDHGFNVPNIIINKCGNLVETKNTPWGTYHAVVFESVGDRTLENIQMTEEIAYQYGSSLAHLHQISQKKMHSNIARDSVYDIFHKIETESAKASSPSTVFLKHVQLLRLAFEKLEKKDYTFG